MRATSHTELAPLQAAIRELDAVPLDIRKAASELHELLAALRRNQAAAAAFFFPEAVAAGRTLRDLDPAVYRAYLAEMSDAGHRTLRIEFEREINLGADGKGAASELVLRRAADIAPESVKWAWPGRIAFGKVTMVAGDPGLGKSSIAAAVTSAATHGGPWPGSGSRTSPIGVLILSAEDDVADTIRPRLDAAGADVHRVLIVDAVRQTGGSQRRMFSLARDLVALEEALRAHPDVRMVFIDPISAYTDGVDSHVNAAVRGLLGPVAELAARLRVAFVAISHLNKGSASPLYRVTGSLAFVAAARAVHLVVRDPDVPNRRLFLPIKNNLALDQSGLACRIVDAHGVPVVQWEAEPVTVSAEALLSPPSDHERADASREEEARAWLDEQLRGGPTAVKDLQAAARGAGFSWRTIERAKAGLSIKASKGSMGGGWCWQSSDGELQL